jgi:WXG100 family type VII secretion target
MEKVASQFSNAAEACSKTMQAVKSRYSPLAEGGWIGQGAEAYKREQEEQVFPEMQRLQKALQDAAKITQAINKLFQDASDEASSLLHI